MIRYGMVIDLLRCIGCNSCTFACKAEHGTPPGIQYNRVKKYEIGTYPVAKMKFLPMSCMHCQDPACLKVCPTGATYKRDDGLVLIDDEKCIGCRYCVVSCPYNSRQFLQRIDHYYSSSEATPYEKCKQPEFAKGTAVKCDFCAERLAQNRLPACVETCPAEARTFGNLGDPESEVSRLIIGYGGSVLHEEIGTGPSVYYIRG